MTSSPLTQSSSTLPNSLATTIAVDADSQPPQTQPLVNQSQDPLLTSTSSSAMLTHADAIPDADLDATLDTEMDVDAAAPATQADPQPQPQQAEHDGAAAAGGVANAIAPADDVRVPQKKDASLREFLSKMDEYGPIIPDAITTHYLLSAGLPAPPTTPLPLARLLALATQKFVADIAADAYQYARIRSSNSSSANALGALAGAAGGGAGAGAAGGGGAAEKGKAGGAHLGIQRAGYGGGGAGGAAGGHGAHGGKTVLTMEDLGMAVGEYGVSVRRGEFYR